MVDFETIRTIVLITLIAIVATLLRRRAGFMIVLWAFAPGFFIAAKIIKMQATRHLNEAIHTAKLTGDEERRCIV
jgi:hypothetical protein